METQLIHANLDILYDILGDMTKIQAKAHGSVSHIIHHNTWKINKSGLSRFTG